MKISDQITHFHAYLLTQRRVANNTYLAYKRDLAQFETFLIDQKCTSLPKVSSSDLKKFLSLLRDQKLSARSIARKIATLKAFFSYCADRYDMPNPAESLIMPKLKQTLPEYLSEEEIELLFDTAKKDQSRHGKRNLIMLYTMYVTGLRVSELVHLKVSDVQADTSCICVMGKGNRQRLVPMPRAVMAMITDYLVHVRASLCNGSATDYLFPTVYGKVARPLTRQSFWTILKNIWKKAGLARSISPHKLRHSFATHMLKKGVNLRSLQLLLGHENIATVQIYTHVETSYLRSLYDKKHPRS